MARKIFDQIRAGVPGVAPAPAPEPAADDAAAAAKRQNMRSVGGLREGLRELTINSIRDLDPALIEADGLRDRLDVDDDGIAALAESIRQHGQQVPILVRPSGVPDRFRVVYGRRRLAAVRRLGIAVKAIVRTLDDRASVLAQGQENSLRLDPSFIEKAVFVGAMRAAGYDSSVIQDALNITRQAVSQYGIVQETIPLTVIEAIGPAHDIGRRRWTELANLARQQDVDLAAVADGLEDSLAALPHSEARFEAVLAAAAGRRAAAAAPVNRGRQPAVLQDDAGTPIAEVRRSGRTLTIGVDMRAAPEFGQWLEAQAAEILRDLHRRWSEDRRQGTPLPSPNPEAQERKRRP